MGITVHYKGALDDPQRIEDLEDRMIDFALEVRADVRIWRSAPSSDPRRVIRGVIVNLVPGQETTSLLFSPEGWLVNLFEIEDAELGRLKEPSWCCVKTQFGNVDGHVLLVEMLDALQKEFMTGLEVSDESGYQESRNVSELRAKFSEVQAAIDGLTAGLRRHGLSPEAAEDPQIVAARIERIAHQVHRVISRPAEHPPVHLTDDIDLGGDLAVKEAEWDALYKENRRRQERLQRAIEERLERGEEAGEAFDGALRDEGIIDLPPLADEDEHEQTLNFAEEFGESLNWEDGPWEQSLSESFIEDDEDEDRHPLQERALNLMLRLHEVSKHVKVRDSYLETLHGGAGEILGGLAQALGPHADSIDLGLSLVQLKRALRGAAFARGALIPLCQDDIFDESIFKELDGRIEQMEADILNELERVRAEI